MCALLILIPILIWSNIFKSCFDSWRWFADCFILISEILIHISNCIWWHIMQIHQFGFSIPSFTKFLDIQQINLCTLCIHKSLLFFQHLVQFLSVNTCFSFLLRLLGSCGFDWFHSMDIGCLCESSYILPSLSGIRILGVYSWKGVAYCSDSSFNQFLYFYRYLNHILILEVFRERVYRLCKFESAGLVLLEQSWTDDKLFGCSSHRSELLITNAWCLWQSGIHAVF